MAKIMVINNDDLAQCAQSAQQCVAAANDNYGRHFGWGVIRSGAASAAGGWFGGATLSSANPALGAAFGAAAFGIGLAGGYRCAHVASRSAN